MVIEGHQGREEVQDDRGVHKVDPFSYGVGDLIRAGGRGGGELGESEFDFVLG